MHAKTNLHVKTSLHAKKFWGQKQILTEKTSVQTNSVGKTVCKKKLKKKKGGQKKLRATFFWAIKKISVDKKILGEKLLGNFFYRT